MEFAGPMKRGIRRLLGRTDPIILMYHRVAEATIDPWGLAVAPGRFREQMAELADTRHPVPLDWIVAELLAGRRPQRAVAVTFDDAYCDVLQDAAPILAEHSIPATVFVVSEMIGANRGYWWDELAELVLGADVLPKQLILSFRTQNIDVALVQGDRCQLLSAIWSAVRILPPADRYAAVAEVAGQFGLSVPAAPITMNAEELKRLTKDGLIALGVHCATHPSLPSLSESDQEQEIAECKSVLERITGTPNRRLAYPYGDFDARSERVARRLGFDYAVSVAGGPAVDAKQQFRLPRNDVKNWNAAQFRDALRWFG